MSADVDVVIIGAGAAGIAAAPRLAASHLSKLIAPLRAREEIVSEGATRRGNVSCPASIPTYVRPYCRLGSNLAMSTEPLRGSDVISVRELADMRSAGKALTVLDVREARELDVCRLEGSLHIPMAEVSAHTDDLPTDQLLVVICHHGARSQMVVDFLRGAGFDNAVNLDGGIDAWACDVDQSMPRYR
jgi:rhodanese-related sulfurtransferase